jgi:hypothetical protein
MRPARTCYDHLAGRLGVAIADRLIADELVTFDGRVGAVTEAGAAFFAAHGIDIADTSKSARPVCRPCLDCSERRPHVAGKLGAAICAHYLDRGYVRRRDGGRALEVTAKGRRALRDMFGITELP